MTTMMMMSVVVSITPEHTPVTQNGCSAAGSICCGRPDRRIRDPLLKCESISTYLLL
jgi:hypothetical protein